MLFILYNQMNFVIICLESGDHMSYFKKDAKRLPVLFTGFIFLSIGIMLTKRAGLGMAPWGVFHQGMSILTTLSFGVITQIFGVIILVASVVFLKTKVGIGTILNVAIVGLMIDAEDLIFKYTPTTIGSQLIIFIIGMLFMTFGRSLYISARLGSGPRDGVFVGLARVTGIEVKFIKPAIEATVLIIGWLLGGVVGYGTVIAVVTSGYLVQGFMTILNFNPKGSEQSNIVNYFK